MAEVPVLGYQKFWKNKQRTLKSEYHILVGQDPDADTQVKQVFKVLWDIEDLTGYTTASVGGSVQCTPIINT
jgi:hypothetical protein